MMSEYIFDPEEVLCNTASMYYQVFYSPPLSLSFYLQYYSEWLTSCSHITARLYSHCQDKTMQVLFSFCSVCLMSKKAQGSRCELFFFNTALSQTSVIKWITWHKASSKLVLFHSRWILPDLYFDGCCSCSGTINSIVVNIDFPQVIIICHILDIRGLNAASQMAFWLIGTMLRGGSNTEAILIRSVAPLLYHYNPSLFPVKYTDGVKRLRAVA